MVAGGLAAAFHHSGFVHPQLIIKSAAQAGIDSWELGVAIILMVTLWVLNAKCKAQEITKEAILCKYSRHRHFSPDAVDPTICAESLCVDGAVLAAVSAAGLASSCAGSCGCSRAWRLV